MYMYDYLMHNFRYFVEPIKVLRLFDILMLIHIMHTHTHTQMIHACIILYNVWMYWLLYVKDNSVHLFGYCIHSTWSASLSVGWDNTSDQTYESKRSRTNQLTSSTQFLLLSTMVYWCSHEERQTRYLWINAIHDEQGAPTFCSSCYLNQQPFFNNHLHQLYQIYQATNESQYIIW